MREIAPDNPPTSLAAGTGRRSTPLIAAIVAIVALIVGAVVGALFLSSSAEPISPVDATATIVVRPTGPPASVEEDGNRIQFRDLTLAGEITLTTTDGREITGELSFGENEDITFGDAGPEIAHIWGPVTATLDGVACQGSFAVTSFLATGEEGGALALRCEDGTALAGNLREAQVEIGPDGFLEQLTRELVGWYVPAE